MSWGVATQNGVSVSLASIMSLSCGATEFSPASLFTSGVVGAWYDPSDVLLNWRTNLLTYTEQLDNAAWTLSNASRSVGVTDPNGGTAAATITATAANGYIRYAYSASAAAATNSIYIRRRTGTGAVYLNPPDNASSLTLSLTSSWQRVQVSSTGTIVSLIVILQASGDAIDIAFPQLELGSTATTYQAITTPEQTYLTYDPQPVLYQDSAGTTPVTAVEQPVGLMLDKSQGLVLGSEATSGAWLNTHTTTFDTFTSTGPSSFTATTTGAKAPRVAVLASLPAAGWYWIEFTATFTGGSFSTVGVSNTGSPYSAAVATTVLPATGVAFRTLIYTSAAREYLTITFTASAASTLSVSGVSVKSLAGNHALQATSASRPILRARYNLLTYSEQFDNAAWAKTNVTLTANAIAAPDGTLTADNAAISAATAVTGVYSNAGVTVSVGTFTVSCYVKANGVQYANVGFIYSGGIFSGTQFDLTNGTVVRTASANYTSPSATITPLSNGWYRCTHTITVTTALLYPLVAPSNALWTTGEPRQSLTGDGTSGIYIWGADLRTGSSAGTYQRIAAATDYDTAGFLPYLYFVTDDSFATNSIDFTATDKMYFSAGVTKLGTSASILAELSANIASNAGSFYIGPNVDGSTSYTLALQGNAGCSYSATSYSAPITNTISVQYNIGGSGIADEIIPKVNGATPTLTATGANAGTGNFGNYPLYIGRRNNASLPFNGNFYQLIVCGKTLSASELASTEAYVNQKTGAY